MTILQLSEHCFLAILKTNGAIYSAVSTTPKAAHVAVMAVMYGN